MFAMPYQWVFECFAPLIEICGWLALIAAAARGVLGNAYVLVMMGGYLLSALVSLGAVLIEEMVYHRYNQWSDLLRLVGYCVLEPLFYRPLNTIWRLRGLWHFLRNHNSWELLPRNGFAKARPSS